LHKARQLFCLDSISLQNYYFRRLGYIKYRNYAEECRKKYFKKIGEGGIDFTLRKPFSDVDNVGALLSDIAAVMSLLPKPPAKLIDLGCGSG
jgi:hypothetical protein